MPSRSTASTLPDARPIRAGVFETLAQADRAVADLLAAGFTKDQITVICSDEAIELHFAEFEHQDPAGTHTPTAAIVGGAIGAVLGGLTAVGGLTLTAGAAATGGAMLLAATGAAAWAGGIVGGLVGAMMTRGIERELANYYDQAVAQGKILVAADAVGDTSRAHQGQRLAIASRILAEAGAEPVPLPEG